MRGILVIILTFCFLVQPYCNIVLAKNEDKMECAWGVVKEASNDSIVVTEKGHDADIDIEVIYSISSDAKVDDISIGDTVKIEYFVVGDKNEVKAISVETGGEK